MSMAFDRFWLTSSFNIQKRSKAMDMRFYWLHDRAWRSGRRWSQPKTIESHGHVVLLATWQGKTTAISHTPEGRITEPCWLFHQTSLTYSLQEYWGELLHNQGNDWFVYLILIFQCCCSLLPGMMQAWSWCYQWSRHKIWRCQHFSWSLLSWFGSNLHLSGGMAGRASWILCP